MNPPRCAWPRGSRWFGAALSLLLCATPGSAQLPNAWQITDGSASASLHYTNILNSTQQFAATNNGFSFAVNARFVTNYNASKTMAMIYGLGTHRFLIWWNLNSSNDLTAELEGQGTYTLTTNGTGTTLYHTHEIVFDPGSQTAAYMFDGQVVVSNWLRSGNAWPAGSITWGGASSAGRAQMNFHSLSFQVSNVVVAAYDAGNESSPPAAPDPQSNGWTLNPSTVPSNTAVTAISPDVALLPTATLLPADQFTTNSARFNGLVNPRGSPTYAWFVWGSGTNEGNITGTQYVGDGIGNTNVLEIVAGLMSGVEYTVRLTVTNFLGVVTSPPQVFNLAAPTAATLPPDQFTAESTHLNGEANPNGSAAFAWFEWGNGTNYGNATSPQAIGNGDASTNVVETIHGLSVGPDYDFRLVVSNAYAVALGSNQTFNLTNFLPTAITLAADQITTNSARLNGQANPNGYPAQAWFEWGTDTNYGNVTPAQGIGSSTTVVDFAHTLGSLTGSIIYQFRVVVSNEFGTVTGDGVLFTCNFPTIGSPLPGVCNSSVAWADFDRDGYLDVVLTGSTNATPSGSICQLWRNTGIGFAMVANFPLPGVHDGSVAWADYDNDDLPDLLLSGNGYCQLWRNIGGSFTNVPIPGLPGVYDSSVGWADFDNDGHPDFVVTGRTNIAAFQGISQLWRNIGGGFTILPDPTLPAYDGSIAWADLDNDSWPDFVNSGFNGGFGQTRVRRNLSGTGSFGAVPMPIGEPQGVAESSVAWADYNNDTLPDFLLTGNGGANYCLLYKNTGGSFSRNSTGVGGARQSSVAWADFDNDGLSDFLLTGTRNANASGAVSELWRNTGSGFTKEFLPDLPGVCNGSVTWADFNNDGRIDFLLTGMDKDSNCVSQLRLNNLASVNTPPQAPANLSSTVDGTYVVLSWSPTTDSQTPSAGLGYNIRVGTTPGAGDIVSPMSLANGFRLLPQRGNAEQRLNARIPSRLGTTYWSVQSVDNAYAGGLFATEASFTMGAVLTQPDGIPVYGDVDGNGTVEQNELNAVLNSYWQSNPPSVESVNAPSNTTFQFGLPNLSSLNFQVLATTNIALPLIDWENIGPASLHYEFDDPEATNHSARFYQLVWP